MDIIEQLEWRYATKKFDARKKLSPKKVKILKNAFNLTATSFGLQTIKMVVISEQELRSSLVKYSYNQDQVKEASHLLVICIHDDISDADIDAHFDNVVTIRNTPEHILSPYREELKAKMKAMTNQERQEWSIKQAFIVLGNLMTVCAVEKIDSCPMEGFIAESYDEVLGLKAENLKSVLLLPVGYRAEDDMFASFKKVRKDIKNAIIEM
ncbi:NAD(P)H-dependent oxidoreductase [Flavobacteriales bacterium 34_180_T64]|nr:NAD(P)H-dependent oxidoreductase [Flavobacteriales bacterium 34_180_T64]